MENTRSCKRGLGVGLVLISLAEVTQQNNACCLSAATDARIPTRAACPAKPDACLPCIK